MKTGYAESVTGDYTERLEIVAETTDGRYVVRHYMTVNDLYGNPFSVTGALQLRKKEDIKDIKEEKDNEVPDNANGANEF